MTDQHRAAYREEAHELQSEMEGTLLELERSPGDAELVARVFRQMHTIKGSGAMFGFDEIASFTHEVETVYDKVREGALKVSPDLISLTLEARDRILALLDEGGGSGDAGRSAAQSTLDGFRALLSAALEPETSQAHDETTFRIGFEPPPDVFLRGTNIPALLDELRAMGGCTAVCHTDALPELESLDPERCYLKWDVMLTTDQDENAIRDVFIFVEDGSRISIVPVRDGERRRLGEILVDSGNVKPEVVRTALAEQEHLAAVRPKEARDGATIRVAAEKVDSLMNVVGELVTVDARLAQLTSGLNDPEFQFVAEEIDRLTQKLRDSAMSMRMLPFGASFGRLRRLVRDLSRELGKDIEMSTEGGETELDKTVIEQLNDVFVHVIRNAIDHGIEPAAERKAAGKPPAGRISMSAVHSGAYVLIRIADDGAGLDRERIYAKAVEKGLISPGTDLSEQETYALVLRPGFSTAARVTEISGRGVGMDVVSRVVAGLRGSLEISSRKGAGTAITLKLPLTLAIIDGLLSEVAGEFFVLPQANVLECMEVPRDHIDRQNGRSVVDVRGELVPFVNLRRHFGLDGTVSTLEQIIIAETQRGRVGIVVDRVIGDHQTVIKPLGGLCRATAVFSGATILGDGTIALVLDADRLLAEAAHAA